MTGVLPTWATDTGAVIGICAAGVVVLGALATVVILAVRKIMQPSLDRIEDRISDHMGVEEKQMDRIAIAMDMIANALHISLPTIRVAGGSDEGDDDTP